MILINFPNASIVEKIQVCHAGYNSHISRKKIYQFKTSFQDNSMENFITFVYILTFCLYLYFITFVIKI